MHYNQQLCMQPQSIMAPSSCIANVRVVVDKRQRQSVTMDAGLSQCALVWQYLDPRTGGPDDKALDRNGFGEVDRIGDRDVVGHPGTAFDWRESFDKHNIAALRNPR